MMNQQLLKELLNYNPDTGIFTWANATNKKSLNGNRAGSTWNDGYRYVQINKKPYLEHRLIWIYLYGYAPKQIDHINAIRSDNRLCNLREANNSQNSMNKTKQSNNTSGYKGVTFHKGTNKYHAKICVEGKRHSLGYYDTAELASQAYIKAQGEYHGEFARQ